MLSNIRETISDNHDPMILLLFGIIIITIIYEFCIGVSETYFLSVYDIIPLFPKTDCERKISFLGMYCLCDFSTALVSAAIGFASFARNERSSRSLKNGVGNMIIPQAFQMLFAMVYLSIMIEMDSSCRDKLKMDTPEVWIIAVIHMFTSCILLLILFCYCLYLIKIRCSRCCGQHNERLLQNQEANYP